jgi:hypothetical protein
VAFKITKKRATRRKPTASRTANSVGAEQQDGRHAHVEIVDLDVLLLQMRDSGGVNVQDVVFNVFESEAARWHAGPAWIAFHKSGMPHHAGLSTWLGISKSVPLQVIEMIETVLRATGTDVERDTGRALHLELNPFARLSDDGLEILVPAALVGDSEERRTIERGGVRIVARGYIVAPRNSASLNNLFFGSGD